MEIKTMQVEELKTLEDLSSAVDYYRAISDEIDRLQTSKAVAKENILAKFRETSLRYYDTNSGLRARTYVRAGQERIDVKEAKALLDEDTLGKLLKVGETTVVLSVRPIKAEAQDDAAR